MEKETKKRITLIITIIILFIILSSLLLYIFIPKNNNEKEILYSEKAINIMKSYDIYDEIIKYNYSKTIEKMLEKENFKTNYIESYLDVNYISIENFDIVTNSLLDKKYNSDEINYILSNDETFINIILNMEYIDILEFKDITNFNINNIERYLEYQKKNDYDIETVVTYVNIGLDLKGYSTYNSYTEEEALEDLTILVNKYNKLPNNYEPNDLVSLSYDPFYTLRKDAAEAYEKLTNAALIDNVIFYPFSAYRSFATQKVLYTRYKNRDGEELADTYSARPGFSEHQSGLAVDIRSNTLNDNLTNKDYEWILKNSYKYGFIVRYPKGKSHITQFIEEPWHLRYLGVDLATKVYESELTYDEYYNLYLNK